MLRKPIRLAIFVKAISARIRMQHQWAPDFSEGRVDIWDIDVRPKSCQHNVLLLRSYTNLENTNWLSIPGLIEENADKYRQRFLKYICKTRVCFRSVRGYDLLCASLIQQKSPYIEKSKVEEAIKLLAIADCLNGFTGITIRVVSSNKQLADSIGLWCCRSGNTFEWMKADNSNNRKIGWLRKTYNSMPEEAKALVWFAKYITELWKLRGVGISTWKATTAHTLFVSYLFNLSKDELSQGKFKSRYWANLPDILIEENHKTNWLHIYMEDDLLPNAKSAAKSIKNFNRK